MAEPQNNQADMNDLDGPEAWFKSLPIVTRTWFSSALLATFSVNFGIIPGMKVIWLWSGVSQNFEIWRFVTPFMYVGPFDFSTLIGLFMLYQYSNQYEKMGPYNTGAGGGTADYVFAMLFGMVFMVGTYPILSRYVPLMPLFTTNLTFYVLYLWSKKFPNARASIWGIPLKAQHLPFAYLGLTVVMGSPYWPLLQGLGAGHSYYFLVDVVPMVYGKDYLHTPQFLIDYFGVGEYRPEAVPPPQAGGGRGRVVNGVWNPPGEVNSPNDPAGGGGGGFRRRAGANNTASRGHNWGGGGQALGTS